MVRLVLFDIDGTLIRSGGAGVQAFGRAFANVFGIDNATHGVSFAGRTDSGLVRELFVRHGIAHTPENAAAFYERYLFLLHELLQHAAGHTLPGTHELIAGFRQLPQPPTLGLLTGNVRLGAEIKLRHYGLWEPFITGAFGDDHECRNELAAIAQRRGSELLATSLRGEEILVIGDTPRDIECARAIRARCLAVATGGPAFHELEAHRPTRTVRDLTEVSAEELCR